MKKYIEILGLGLILSCSAMADTTIPWTKEGCESVKGTWITAHSATDSGCDAAHCNGKSFCISGIRMNWWSGLIWCQSIGHQLTSFANLCPNTPVDGSMVCANIKGLYTTDSKRYGLTTMPLASGNTPFVQFTSGTVANKNRNYASNAYSPYAICEE